MCRHEFCYKLIILNAVNGNLFTFNDLFQKSECHPGLSTKWVSIWSLGIQFIQYWQHVFIKACPKTLITSESKIPLEMQNHFPLSPHSLNYGLDLSSKTSDQWIIQFSSFLFAQLWRLIFLTIWLHFPCCWVVLVTTGIGISFIAKSVWFYRTQSWSLDNTCLSINHCLIKDTEPRRLFISHMIVENFVHLHEIIILVDELRAWLKRILFHATWMEVTWN